MQVYVMDILWIWTSLRVVGKSSTLRSGTGRVPQPRFGSLERWIPELRQELVAFAEFCNDQRILGDLELSQKLKALGLRKPNHAISPRWTWLEIQPCSV